MASLAPYLPPHLVRSLARSGPPRRLPHVERFPAALLLSDISGFTALTERLQERGREGAEQIAAIVNQAFRPAIRAIEAQDGSIVSFGGDALFALFQGAGGVRRSAVAAHEIQATFRAKPEIGGGPGRVSLSISQAIHYGAVRQLHLGVDGRRHCLVGGASVSAVARLQHGVPAGRVLFSREARAQYRREKPPRKWRAARRAPSSHVLQRYLPPELRALRRRFEGEYRRVAVLFLETKGLEARVVQAFFVSLVETLERYEGLLLKTDLSPIGAKWLCVFGIPAAHEEDSRRAAYASLDILKAAPKDLSLRGGLHAGTIVNVEIGSRSRRSIDIMGDVVNTAARALGEAAFGEVVATEEARRSLRGIETRSRGSRRVKGKGEGLAIHAVVGKTALVEPFRVSASMVGRERELGAICDALDRATVGQGGVIAVRGEAGIGKSRLKWEASKVAQQKGFEVHEGRAVSFGGIPYGAVAELLRHALSLGPGDPPGTVAERVEEEARQLGLAPVDRHHLAEVLGARLPGSPLTHLDGGAIRLNNMIAIRAYAAARAAAKPLLLVLEDMHWADEMTREAAVRLATEISTMRAVLVLLHRPGYDPPQEAARIELEELPPDAIGQLLEAHFGTVPRDVERLVRERAEGNPFYVEELARHFLESGVLARSRKGFEFAREAPAADLPDSIESIIEARLDRLPPEVKRIAQYGAVVGRSFLFHLLHRLDPAHAEAGVAELAGREIVFQTHRKPRLEYIFKHALTRDVAYSTILAARRRTLHRDVASAIEELLSDELQPHWAALGYHWEQAQDREKARGYYLRAARKAVDDHAHQEAERLYSAYLRLVDAPTTESIQARNDLGGKVFKVCGRMGDAEEAHQRSLQEAERLGDAEGQAVSWHALGVVSWSTGRMGEARDRYETALTIARSLRQPRLEAVVLGALANLESDQGQMDQARARYQAALSAARRSDNRHGEGVTLGNLALLERDQGRMAEAQALYGQALAVAQEVGDRRHEGHVIANLASLNHEQGQREVARDLYEKALALLCQVGDRRTEGIVRGNMASLLLQQQEFGEARRCYEQALQISRAVGDRQFEGIIVGNMAELAHDQGRMEEVKALYEQALAIAREAGYRRLEAIWLGKLAALESTATGDLVRAATLLGDAESLLSDAGDELELAKLRCTRGHIDIARGRSARGIIERGLAAAERLGAGSDSQLGKALAALQRAQESLDQGRPLVCGTSPEDIPDGTLRWLESRRPDAVPQEILERRRSVEKASIRPSTG